MAIRRSQVGFYSNLSLSKPLSRGNLTSSGLTHFIEGVIDAYQTFITSHYDDSYFYLKGPSFSVMFTHDPEGVGFSTDDLIRTRSATGPSLLR